MNEFYEMQLCSVIKFYPYAMAMEMVIDVVAQPSLFLWLSRS